MKSLREVIESLLDYDDSTTTFEDNFPVVFKPIKKWKFPNTQFGEVWSAKKKIGFYELFGQNKFVTIYTNSELQQKWLDYRASQKYGGPVPKEVVRDWVQKEFNLKEEDTVFWWDAEEYINNIDAGSVPNLGKNVNGWTHFITEFQIFFKLETFSTIKDQINYSKGIYN